MDGCPHSAVEAWAADPRDGLSLIELLLATAILAILAAAGSGLVSSALQSHNQSLSRASLYEDGMRIMDRVTEGIRGTTLVMVPNGRGPVRNLLVLSANVNDDGAPEYYFNDTLFPMADEDPKSDMNNDAKAGVKGVDDDGDGAVDEGNANDDDEDGTSDEETLNGLDDDGDGNIDEDLAEDINKDGKPGFAGINDDGDGGVDEGDYRDDDEGGAYNEDGPNARTFQISTGVSSTRLVQKDQTPSRERLLSDRVSFFRATFQSPDRFVVELKLTDAHGQTVAFVETACARNVRQAAGKRVR
jgi:prepilin-type N-terminal cleavage/methylation domain-containing protein